MASPRSPDDLRNAAAILCEHVAAKQYPMTHAVRSDPVDADDSGWQFLCNSGLPEDPEKAQVWLLREVLAIEPGLELFVGEPPGTHLLRAAPGDRWRKSARP